ncbi:MAG: hypothetical protein MZV63_65710 [Marinilabiliales bacterium]|nr:hypothetical protein [Marinilabiliales bacterium]
MFVVDGDVARQRKVTTGLEGGGWIEITDRPRRRGQGDRPGIREVSKTASPSPVPGKGPKPATGRRPAPLPRRKDSADERHTEAR